MISLKCFAGYRLIFYLASLSPFPILSQMSSRSKYAGVRVFEPPIFLRYIMKWLFLVLVGFAGCVAPIRPYVWQEPSSAKEDEYAPYMEQGVGSVTGQAFLQRKDGMTVRAAGRIVTLDPATRNGKEWWDRPVRYVHEYFDIPPAPAFLDARRCTRADADGNFRFEHLPTGKYYIQTSVTWQPGDYWTGGMVGAMVEIRNDETVSVALGPAALQINRASLSVWFVRSLDGSKRWVGAKGHTEPICPKK